MTTPRKFEPFKNLEREKSTFSKGKFIFLPNLWHPEFLFQEWELSKTSLISLGSQKAQKGSRFL